MNNVLDETQQEIADLKADLQDALKQNSALEKELQLAYAEKGAAPAKPLPVDTTVIDDLRSQLNVAEGAARFQEGKHKEQLARAQMLQADLVMALALVQVVKDNKHEAWTYFTTPQGRERLEWATDKYQKEMGSFTNALGEDK